MAMKPSWSRNTAVSTGHVLSGMQVCPARPGGANLGCARRRAQQGGYAGVGYVSPAEVFSFPMTDLQLDERLNELV